MFVACNFSHHQRLTCRPRRCHSQLHACRGGEEPPAGVRAAGGAAGGRLERAAESRPARGAARLVRPADVRGALSAASAAGRSAGGARRRLPGGRAARTVHRLLPQVGLLGPLPHGAAHWDYHRRSALLAGSRSGCRAAHAPHRSMNITKAFT